MSENAHPPNSESNRNTAEERTDDGLWLVSYADDDDREMTAPDIASALDRGEIDSNTIVWRDGMPEWKPIAEVEALKAQLRRCNLSADSLRRRQTVLGGFGPVRPEGMARDDSHGLSNPKTAADISEVDDDEPTVVQPMFESLAVTDADASGKLPDEHHRHPTSGNTLRIRTGQPPPVMPKAPSTETPNPTPPRPAAEATVEDDSELDSLPSNVLVTAPNDTEVAADKHPRRSAAPPPPTRGIMTRHSDPPETGGMVSGIPRATLTRDDDPRGDSGDEHAAPRRSDMPKPPVPKRVTLLNDEEPTPGADTSSSYDSSSSLLSNDTPTPRATALPATVRGEARTEETESLSSQRTRPPRSRRNHKPKGDRDYPDAQVLHGGAHLPHESSTEAPKKTSGVLLALLGMGAAAAVAFALGKNYGASEVEPTQMSAENPAMASLTAPMRHSAGSTQQASVAAQPSSETEASTGETAPADEPLVTSGQQERPTAPEAKGATGANKAAPRPPSLPERAPVGQSNPTPQAAALAAAAARQAKTERAQAEQSTEKSAAEVSAPGVEGAASVAESTATQGSQEPEAFNASAAGTALGNAATRASACRKEGDPTGVARVTVTFANSGKATRAIVDGPPFAGTPTGGCIAETMRNATVPAFSGERVTVKKTVVIQ